MLAQAAGKVAWAMRMLSLPRRHYAAEMALVLGASGFLVAGCGEAKQDAHEPRTAFTLEVLKANFPAKQAVARPSSFELEVRNASTSTLPNLAVTVRSFYYRSEYPNLADPRRPIWIVDQGPGATPRTPVETVPFDSPGGYETSTTGTWAAGPIASGEARTFLWHLTPVKSGVHTVSYVVSAGLHGNAAARLEDGRPVIGQFVVDVAPAPPINHVNPETGLVEPGRYPVAPGP
jgi:hypothetical protein